VKNLPGANVLLPAVGGILLLIGISMMGFAGQIATYFHGPNYGVADLDYAFNGFLIGISGFIILIGGLILNITDHKK
jgi:NO-binding membrane sensor protein with MHYT domain